MDASFAANYHLVNGISMVISFSFSLVVYEMGGFGHSDETY